MDSPSDITALVNDGEVDSKASQASWQRCYPELRRIAACHLRREAPGQTLQPTALVHEAFLRMVDHSRITKQGTTYFRRCFATECRRILVDEARKRRAQKRGGGAPHFSLCGVQAQLGVDHFNILDLHEAIEELATHRQRLADIVDLRIFGGLTVPQCAQQLNVSTSTIDSDWKFARAWLRRQLEGSTDH